MKGASYVKRARARRPTYFRDSTPDLTFHRPRVARDSLFGILPKVWTHNEILSPPSKPATMVKLDMVKDGIGIDIDDLLTIHSFGGKT